MNLINTISFLVFMIIFQFAKASSDSIIIKKDAYSSRLVIAKEIAEDKLPQLFAQQGIEYPCKNIYWRAFKEQEILELWASNTDTTPYVLINEYKICRVPGMLGPKRKLGDEQVPEGFYTISKFNPYSLYWLSFEISYPNKSDSILGNKYALGGDIYVHGGCKSVGCLPMTDTLMCEIYYVSAVAYSMGTGVVIPFDIFPTKFNKKNWFNLKHRFSHHKGKIKLWKNMELGYLMFENTKLPPHFSIDNKGTYIFNIE